MPKNRIEQIFDFLRIVGKLKTTYRFKTIKHIKGDTTAAHTWRLALFTFMIAEELKLKVNVLHSVKLALTHDLAEAITDDIDALKLRRTNGLREKKRKAEIKAMQKIKKSLPRDIGNMVYNLWAEYEKGETPEAKFVVAMDKIEGVFTHAETGGYKSFSILDFTATYANAAGKKVTGLEPLVKQLQQEIKKEFKKGNLAWKKEYDF